MLFNSIEFAFFLPIVFLLYWLVFNKNLKYQNLLLFVSSCFFYSCWDYRFLFLLLFSIGLDFIVAKKIFNTNNDLHRKYWFIFSISVNLFILFYFKYCNFFIDSFSSFLVGIGFSPNLPTLNVVLPVGISFYTFHELSYIIDVYKRRIEPEKDIIDYSLFVTFFPLLVAGPIERATHLLPQIKSDRVFSYSKAADGLRQMLWGLFKKIVIADNCAIVVNDVFNNSSAFSSSDHILGAIFFAFQIYCDFSGYSDIALGTARLFGFELLKNFSFPYFSRDIAEFWRRWHISLSSWFRDYLYIPLGGSRGSVMLKVRNTFIIFLVSGFWHGANWTFIIWGGLHALFFVPLLLIKKNRENLEIVAKGRLLPNFKELFGIFVTFFLTTFAWIFFRAKDLTSAIQYLSAIFYSSSISVNPPKVTVISTVIVLFFIIEWIGREQQFAIQTIFNRFNRLTRWLFYLVVIILIFNFQSKQQQFIYFHF